MPDVLVGAAAPGAAHPPAETPGQPSPHRPGSLHVNQDPAAVELFAVRVLVSGCICDVTFFLYTQEAVVEEEAKEKREKNPK